MITAPLKPLRSFRQPLCQSPKNPAAAPPPPICRLIDPQNAARRVVQAAIAPDAPVKWQYAGSTLGLIHPRRHLPDRFDWRPQPAWVRRFRSQRRGDFSFSISKPGLSGRRQLQPLYLFAQFWHPNGLDSTVPALPSAPLITPSSIYFQQLPA